MSEDKMQCSLISFSILAVILTCLSHLWCNVVWGAAEGACGHAFVHVLFTHAKVSDLDVALGVQHHIV